MSLPRHQKQEEEDPGSNDHDLHSPKGNAARCVLRHGQLPYREDTSLNLPAGQESAATALAADGKTPCPFTTVQCGG